MEVPARAMIVDRFQQPRRVGGRLQQVIRGVGFAAHPAVELAAGDAVIYPATSLHHVTPITRGSRWSSFFWTQSMVKDDGKRIQLDVKEGDTILFGKYSGQEIKIDGEEFLIMREDEVLAILDK